jgi:hypothetical protein
MRRLKILIWHIHGSYLNTLTRLDHDWYLPVRADHGEGYGGRGWTFDWTKNVREVPAGEAHALDLDLVIYQTPRNYFQDGPAILSEAQLQLPTIYLEHNTPRPSAFDTRHPFDTPDGLLVHVTHYNQLMWDNRATPTAVIEHGVALDPRLRATGKLARGIAICNCMQSRPRIAGHDLFLAARKQVPLDAVGMETEQFGGLGDIPYRDLHRTIARYRFLYSPMRYTSMPLAVVEAMTLGLPVVALATTVIPTLVENGGNGYVSCDPDELIARMRELVADRELARKLGKNARAIARERFGMDRFTRDWEAALAQALDLRPRHAATRAEQLARA